MGDEVGDVLEGGRMNRGSVIRIGERVIRPRSKGADAAEAMLLHLESVDFAGAPRFLGHDQQGRQVLSYVDGTVYSGSQPPWIDDDAANARVLGRLSALVRELHDALQGFVPPPDVEVFRPLPVPGLSWNHADVHYANTAFRDETPVGLIDFDFCAPGGRMYDAATVMFCSRCPRPDHPDNPRRERSALLTVNAVLDGYRATDDERAGF